MNFKRICVGSKVGSLSGFASNDNGLYLGLSAFHVLSGSNRQIDTFDDIVEVFNEATSSWLQLGTTIEGRYYKGDGSFNNYGILDYAYFEICNSFFDKIKNNIVEVDLSHYLFTSNKSSLINMDVFGHSVIDEKQILGRVAHVFYQANNNRFDLEIEILEGYTHEGDSGMLWKDVNGKPLSMHIRGNSQNYSTKSYSTFFDRIIGERTFYTYIERHIV